MQIKANTVRKIIFTLLPVMMVLGGILGWFLFDNLGAVKSAGSLIGVGLLTIIWYYIFSKLAKDLPPEIFMIKIYEGKNDTADIEKQPELTIEEPSKNIPIAEKFIQPPKEEPPVEDDHRKNYLILIPEHRGAKKHRNKIKWYDQYGKKHSTKIVQNDPFDFLYYLAWLNKKSNSKGLKKNGKVPPQHIEEIFQIDDKYVKDKLGRFQSKWADGDEAQKEKKKSFINRLFCSEIIIQKSIHYRINDGFDFELKPYPTD